MIHNKIRYIIFITLLLINIRILPGQDTDSLRYRSLDPYYFHLEYIIDSTSLLIDVREFFEYRHSRIRDAINIPTSGGFDAAADTTGKDHSLFLYCYNGYRSSKAAEFFVSKGFTKVYNLEGGIVGWRKDNMPVDKTRVRRRR